MEVSQREDYKEVQTWHESDDLLICRNEVE
jgi:hypothetical protein